MIHCDLCGLSSDFSRMRCISKTHGKFRCVQCGTKSVQMRRALTTWPTEEFLSLSEENRQKWYREMAHKTAKECIKAYEEVVAESEMSSNYSFGGKYLPLSVWDKAGYDIERIARLSREEDRMEHEILGTCYRVKILQKFVAKKDTQKVSKRAAARTALPEAPAPLALEDGDVESQDEGRGKRDSSPSSSASSGKKRKRRRDSSNSSSSSSRKKKKSKKDSKKSKKDSKKEKKHKKDKKGAREDGQQSTCQS
jgi:hypothetical protein